MLVLTAADVEAVLPMAAMIDTMTDALRSLATGAFTQPERWQIRAGSGPILGIMPAFQTRPEPLWSVKTVLYAAANRNRGLHPHQGIVALYDGETGRPRAIIDAGAITAVRTAASSAAATRALARADWRCVAIIGTGTQARSHVAAMRCLLPEARILIAGRSPERAALLAAATDTEWAPTVESAVRQADVICTVTAAESPVIATDWVRAGYHINAVGASSPDRRELEGALLAQAECFVDSRSQAEAECGEYLLALAEGHVRENPFRCELGDVLAGKHPGRSGPGATTVFKSLGMAVEDLRAATLAVELAQQAGIGLEVTF